MPASVATILAVLRYAALAAFVLAGAAALASWAVRTRRINPFSHAGRLARQTSDWIVRPIETWVLRRGGNPQNAGWWLVGITLAGGIVIVSGSQWLVVQVYQIGQVAAAGPRSLVRLILYYASEIVLLALIVRVIGSWIGVGRFNRWMRPAYVLTDWIVEPLRRVIPPFGMIDVTPLVAWFLVLLLRGWLLSVI